MNAPQQPPPGWYSDPDGPPGQLRWWDGTAWSEHVKPAPAPPAPLTPTTPAVPAQGPRSTAKAASQTGAQSGGGPSQKTWWWIAGIAAAVIVIGSIAGSSSDSSKPKQAKLGPPGAVAGDLSKDCSIECTSPDAADNLQTEDVWCNWKGGDVVVHARLTNDMNANVHLSIVPKYFLEKGGQHGTSFGSDIPIKLAAGETLDWTGSAGQPEGVAPGLQISACEPRLQDIDVG